MILVLLYRFNASPESLPGYILCQKLIQTGHDLLVTSTAPKDELKKEKEAATLMTEKWRGSVKIIEPDFEDLEEPTPEWIAKSYKQYFGHLSRQNDVHTIIGTLPGTAKTAVVLKGDLGCRLVLLTTTMIEADLEQQRAEVRRLYGSANEVWSFGSEMFAHYEDIFQEVTEPHVKHEQIMLGPEFGNSEPFLYWEWNSPIHNRSSTEKKIVSVWNKGYPYFFKGKPSSSRGSCTQSYKTFSSALMKINTDAQLRDAQKIQWNVHGLKGQEEAIKFVRNISNTAAVQLTPLNNVKALKDITWKNCSAFIVPDYNDESFNFIALAAVWQGIPTIVSAESPIGKRLLDLPTPCNTRPIISLTGNPTVDEEKWIQKLYLDILNDTASSMEWARQLSSCLHDQAKKWDDNFCIVAPILATSHDENADVTDEQGTVNDPKGDSRMLPKAAPLDDALLSTECHHHGDRSAMTNVRSQINVNSSSGDQPPFTPFPESSAAETPRLSSRQSTGKPNPENTFNPEEVYSFRAVPSYFTAESSPVNPHPAEVTLSSSSRSCSNQATSQQACRFTYCTKQLIHGRGLICDLVIFGQE